jgi:hypothetical protein
MFLIHVVHAFSSARKLDNYSKTMVWSLITVRRYTGMGTFMRHSLYPHLRLQNEWYSLIKDLDRSETNSIIIHSTQSAVTVQSIPYKTTTTITYWGTTFKQKQAHRRAIVSPNLHDKRIKVILVARPLLTPVESANMVYSRAASAKTKKTLQTFRDIMERYDVQWQQIVFHLV